MKPDAECEFHRDAKRLIAGCDGCPLDDDCNGVVAYLGLDLMTSGIMPEADPRRFYFRDPCPLREQYEEGLEGWFKLQEEEK